jgi:uncharacterized protein (TIGR02453 family)
MAVPPRTFEGFPASGLRFLAALAKHNERAWFQSRKERYEREVLHPMRAFVADASAALSARGIPLVGDEKRSVFRIYRDVRFSDDKRPYKTFAAAYLSYDGGRKSQGGLYLCVAPQASFLAIAFYRIEAPMLQRWRVAMRDDPHGFTRVVRALAKRGLAVIGPEERDDSLARLPRAFAPLAGHELEPYFRLRSFTLRRALTPHEVTSPRLLEIALDFARDAKPLLEFGWRLD